MNILILVKQVPETEGLRLSAGEIFKAERYELPLKLSTFDRYVIEEAKRIKEAYRKADIKPCSDEATDIKKDSYDTEALSLDEKKDESDTCRVVALSMGEATAKRVLVEALSIVADKAYLVSDEILRGSDSIATAKVLKAAIRRIETLEGRIDLIIAGRQSNDGSTAQVGVALSELMDIGLVTSAVSISSDGHTVKAVRRLADSYEEVRRELPALITMTKPDHDVSLPTFKRIRWANREKIEVFDAEALKKWGLDIASVGAEGSATKLLSVKKAGRKSKNSIINVADYESGEAAAKLLLQMLDEGELPQTIKVWGFH